MSASNIGELQFIEGNTNANIYCGRTEAEHDSFFRKLGRRTLFKHNEPK